MNPNHTIVPGGSRRWLEAAVACLPVLLSTAVASLPLIHHVSTLGLMSPLGVAGLEMQKAWHRWPDRRGG
jgi:hypothetical protein